MQIFSNYLTKRDLTFVNMVVFMEKNAKKEQDIRTGCQQQTSQSKHPRQEQRPEQKERHDESQQHSSSSSVLIPSLGLFDTTNPVYDPDDEAFRRRLQQKKKKKRGPRL